MKQKTMINPNPTPKTFNELLEKGVSNIVRGCLVEVTGQETGTIAYMLADLEGLIYSLLEFIEKRDSAKIIKNETTN